MRNSEETPHRDIVVVGASAGGVQALSTFAGGLPVDLPASVFVVMHIMAEARSMLAQILGRSGPLPATTAGDGERIVPGHIYVAPPGLHLLLHPGVIHLTRRPREKGYRPGIDPLFRSAAEAYGPRVIGIVLSGLLRDGAEGLREIRGRGGRAIVQDPEEALFDAMPKAAMQACEVDRVVLARSMGAVLADWTSEPLPAADPLERS
jgi:two-component system, chemotaxis family, protein-glutamate methylesterase/glutaminase